MPFNIAQSGSRASSWEALSSPQDLPSGAAIHIQDNETDRVVACEKLTTELVGFYQALHETNANDDKIDALLLTGANNQELERI